MVRVADDSHLIRDSLSPRLTHATHTTSLEAALVCLHTGRFQREYFSNCPHNPYPGFLFCVPNAWHFKGDRLLAGFPRRFNWKDAAGSTQDSNGFLHFMASQIGYYHPLLIEFDGTSFPKMQSEFREVPLYRRLFRELAADLQEDGFTKEDLLALLRKATQRRGVMLGFNESIRSMRIAPMKEEYEICIYRPSGFETKHLSGIVPLGPIERRVLAQYRKNPWRVMRQYDYLLAA